MTPPPSFDRPAMRSRLLRAALQEANTQTRLRAPSRALREGQFIRTRSDTEGDVVYPHYWAYYVHEGRNEIRPRDAQWLVWYRDPRLDPRNQPNYPVRVTDRRRLSREEFREAIDSGRAVVSRRAGAVPGNPWLTEGMQGAGLLAIVQATRRAMDREMRRQFPIRERRIRIILS